MNWLKGASVVFAIALGGCAVEEGILLDEDQLKRLLAREKSFDWVGFGFSGNVTFDDQGKANLTVVALGADEGEWKREGTTVCVEFARAMRGERRCAAIARLQNGDYEARDPRSGRRLGLFCPPKDKE